MAFAATIAAAMLGALHAGAADGERNDAPPAPIAMEPQETSLPTAAPIPEPMPEGWDVPPELLAMLDAPPDVIVDLESGVRVGPLTIHSSPESIGTRDPVPTARRRPSRPAPPPRALGPRLHRNPGRHVIATARQMMARGERIQGSCYRYLSEVFARAGHDDWRTRRVVYGGGRGGPYASLDLIRPGDWLYIVNHPDRVPVGTHSVLFIGWEDRARGYARVIEHSGWGAPSAGQERSYDVSRTYRVTRPVLPR